MSTRTDEEFAADLRALVDDVAPVVDVDVAGVVPAARRRRARRRATVSVAATGVVALTLGWAVQAQPWQDVAVQPWRDVAVQPAQRVLSVDPPPAPQDPADAVPVDPAVGGWPDAAYWHVTTTSVNTTTAGTTTTEHRESWYGRTDPSLVVVDGNLDPDALIATGPASWGRIDIDGVDTILRWDVLPVLPTDPAALGALLVQNVHPEQGVGTSDDKVFQSALDLLSGSPAPVALRDALWQVMTTLPGSTVDDAAQDSTGRAGVAVERTIDGQVVRAVYDTAGRRLLESWTRTLGTGEPDGTGAAGFRVTFLGEEPSGPPPVDPTLEMAGCTQWDRC
ncbi:hypothetical protein ET495_17230 [Xylanimonas allomyrinae]|uniref:Uncharacterized protein n=1 Tax=Xylanimonas allomyrinae TaxID=2509459 RepID=A0A4V0YEL7_9MICO|nr:hypothetical protein [Xylanimonas allomyrinae]QAY64651.1 hypothetical protein ET495_17230 [Xylanimonas allomyrinae]